MHSEKKQNDIILELLLIIYNKRVRLLMLGVLIIFISFLVFKIFSIKYSSTLTFLIDNSDPAEVAVSETEQFAMSQLRELSNNRMYLVLFSDEMAKRLEENIEIGKHYELNAKDPNYVSNIVSCMHSNVDIEKGISNTVQITVKDNNKEFAATFANAIYSNLVGINTKIVHANLNYKKDAYQLDIGYLDSQNKKDMEKFLAELNKIQTTNKTVPKNDDEILLLKQDLFNLFGQYNLSSAELKKSALKHQVTLSALNDTTLQNLYLINRAYPQNNTGAYVSASLWSLCLAIAGVFYYSLSLIYIQRTKFSLREMIKNNGSSFSKIQVSTGNTKKNFIVPEEAEIT